MLKNTLTVFNSKINYKMKFLAINLLFGTFMFTLSSCNWNRTEKAQQQIYASGPDAPSALSETLQRNQDYYKISDEKLLSKML